ncbi:MAG: hypothetical protein PSN46_09475 [Gammaproteobacteria bacterium]|nr:hypothetical protein [Gammaproteobacteria bacterium]
MNTYVDGYAPTYDAKFLLNGIALMENISVGRVLNHINKGRKDKYSVYDYMENLPLPLDLKQSLRQRYQADKVQSDKVMQQCYKRSIKGMKNVGLWLLPVVLVLILLV